MASGDENHRDEDEAEFGPPVSGFGPPLNDFGPPTGDKTSVGWQPFDEPARQSFGWQPADSGVAQPNTQTGGQARVPEPQPPETVRRGIQDPRSTSQRSGAPARDEGKWWDADSADFPPTPPPTATPRTGSSGSLWDDDELAKKLRAPRAGGEAGSAGSSSSSLWDDDDLAKKLSPPRPAVSGSSEGEDSHRNRKVLLGGFGVGVALIVALVVIVVFVTGRGGKDDNSQASGGATSDACLAHTDGNVTTGNGQGDTATGVNAIMGYQYAYYTLRDAVKVHTFVAAEANLQPAEALQKTIDQSIPPRTTYCLRIVTNGTPNTAPNSQTRYNVEITEHHVDGTSKLWLETVTTVNQNGRNLISMIQGI